MQRKKQLDLTFNEMRDLRLQSKLEYTTLDTRVDIDSSLETIESIPTSVDKLGAKLIGNQEQPKPNFSDKKVKRILIKKII